MTRPTRRCVLLGAVGLLVALLPAILGATLWPAWLVFVIATAAALAFDLAALLPNARLVLEAHAPEELAVGRAGALELRLAAERWRQALTVDVRCELSEPLERQPDVRVRLPAGRTARVAVALRSPRRGRAELRAAWLRWTGPLGLVERSTRRGLERTVSVLPDLAPVRAASLRFAGSTQALSGSRTERFTGEGSEFDSLRPHVPGLDTRHIDWKASARNLRLMSRLHRAEREHPVVIALDVGHLMGERLDGIPRLDHAIHAGLALAACALRAGDQVGLTAFDARPRLWLPPRGGTAAFARIRRAVAGLAYGTDESNFTLAMLDLVAHLPRRTLVVVFTDFVDSVTSELMVENVLRLAHKHVVLFVALRDPVLDASAEAAPATLRDLHRAVAAAELRREREGVLLRLRRAGVHVLEAQPRQLVLPLVERWLALRRRELA
jgi:uncharacterized protein (DUF58 family)